MTRRRIALGDALLELIDHRGKTPKKLGGDWTSTGHRVVSAINIKDSRVDDNDHHYVDGELYKKWMKVPLLAGDVLLTSEAPTGEVAYLEANTDWCLGQRLFGLRADPAVLDGRYLYYQLRGGEARRQLLSRATGTTVSGIRQSELIKVELELPPLAEQRGVAETLGLIDAKIASNRRAVDHAETLADRIFRSKATTKIALGDVADLTMGSSPPGSTYNHRGEGVPFYQGIRDFGRRLPGYRVWTTGPVRLACENDTLVSVRAPVGELNRAREQCCIGRGVAAARSKWASTLYYALRSADSVWEPFHSQGTVFGSINKADLSKAQLAWPDQDAADDVESTLSAIDARLHSLCVEIEKLAALRDRLLPALLSGSVAVPEARESVA